MSKNYGCCKYVGPVSSAHIAKVQDDTAGSRRFIQPPWFGVFLQLLALLAATLERIRRSWPEVRFVWVVLLMIVDTQWKTHIKSVATFFSPPQFVISDLRYQFLIARPRSHSDFKGKNYSATELVAALRRAKETISAKVTPVVMGSYVCRNIELASYCSTDGLSYDLSYNKKIQKALTALNGRSTFSSNPTEYKDWDRLNSAAIQQCASKIGWDEEVRLKGSATAFNRTAMHILAIFTDPLNPDPYVDLSSQARRKYIQLPKMGTLGERDLLLKAIDLNGGHARALHALGTTMTYLGEKIRLLNGTVMSVENLFAEAVRAKPTNTIYLAALRGERKRWNLNLESSLIAIAGPGNKFANITKLKVGYGTTELKIPNSSHNEVFVSSTREVILHANVQTKLSLSTPLSPAVPLYYNLITLNLPKANINAFSVSPQRRVVAVGEQNPCVLVLQSKYFDYPFENKSCFNWLHDVSVIAQSPSDDTLQTCLKALVAATDFLFSESATAEHLQHFSKFAGRLLTMNLNWNDMEFLKLQLIKVGREIGSGGEAKVYEAQVQEKEAAVVKVPQWSDGRDDHDDRCLSELLYIKLLSLFTLSVVQCYGWVQHGRNKCIVLERMDSSLGHHLVDVKINKKSLSLSEVAVVGRAVAKALQVMHGLGTMHRDLCPDNILVLVERGKIVKCKVADFGVAHHKDNTPTDIGGKDQWRAPEQSIPESDIFSFGLVMFYVFGSANRNGRLARAEQYPDEPVYAFHDDELIQDLPTSIINIVRKCLVGKPAARPKGEDLLKAFENWK